MLDSTSRRPAFDAFFASLDEAAQNVFMAHALEQRETLQKEETRYEKRPVSLIDCMENVWDMWTDLAAQCGPNKKDADGIVELMWDEKRIARYTEYQLHT